jgi:predicted NBD/HSP70 family sugar kinase
LRLQELTNYEKDVFSKLQKEGPMTKKALLSYFDYKSSTLNRIILSLLRNGAIVEIGQEESSGGRKPSLFDIQLNHKYVIGIDLSRTYIYIAVYDLKMKLKTSDTVYIDDRNNYTPRFAVDSIAQLLGELLSRCALTLDDILGAGVGMVGPVNRNSGMTGDLVGLRDDWKNIPIQKMLETAIGCPVYIDNGAYAAVLAEYLYGKGKNYKSISYFNCEIGIRSGYISSGVLIRAANDVEDLFSHTVINVMGERCYCGKRGCVRCYASTPVISENVRRRIRGGEQSCISVPPESINYLHILAAAEKEDEVAADELRSAGFFFGVGLGNYIILLNPEYVVIDGPLVLGSNIFYDSAVQAAKSSLFASDKTKITFKRGSSFGLEAISVGAAAMFYERFMGNPITE